ncbi:MAG: RluA family pseudouridine synthase [Christensenellaceae bacterium]|jgi:23S rRNA pseudouridine1911/1915/1917 synthase|nr:RluA family pseudouridine synthase [Christensenellaceae bacterium]
MEIPIIHEDNHIVVIIKPQNIEYEEVMRRLGETGTVVKSVHRLDAVTGGVMVFAKSRKAAERLSEQIRKREVEKKYLCVVEGVPRERGQTLKNYLIKDEKRNVVSVVPQATEGAIYAELRYEVVKTVKNLSFLMVELETGRSHQIRVQLKNIGCPLFGDIRYNPRASKGNIALWSYKLSFCHPTTKEKLSFVVYPEDGIWEVFREDFRFI